MHLKAKEAKGAKYANKKDLNANGANEANYANEKEPLFLRKRKIFLIRVIRLIRSIRVKMRLHKFSNWEP